MATLFERIIGADEAKIPIHGIRALATQLNRQILTFEQTVVIYELDAEQQADWANFLSKMNSSPDKVALSNFIFDWLVLAELGVMPEKYRDEVAFWAAVDAEIAVEVAASG